MENIAVFLDRDGTINEEKNFVKSPEEIKLIPNSGNAIEKLNGLGIKVIIISNQSGIARGLFSEEDLVQINNKLKELLLQSDAFIDHLYYCPHHPEGIINQYRSTCNCRKPKIGLIENAEKDFNIIKEHSYMIGDMERDIECGNNAGMLTILVLTGKGTETKNSILLNQRKVDYIACDLLDAVTFIENDLKNKLH